LSSSRTKLATTAPTYGDFTNEIAQPAAKKRIGRPTPADDFQENIKRGLRVLAVGVRYRDGYLQLVLRILRDVVADSDLAGIDRVSQPANIFDGELTDFVWVGLPLFWNEVLVFGVR
jgi:hypothetical protein